MKYLTVLLLIGSAHSIACDEITGVYNSDSESHWHYSVSINGSDLYVNYSNYWYAEDETNYGEERYEVHSDFTGYCRKKGSEYVLKFDNKKITVTHNDYSDIQTSNKNTQKISGIFFGKQRISLWANK